MRVPMLWWLGLLCALPAQADYAALASAVKASLVFRADYDAARHYPHILNVYLRLENSDDSSVEWVANRVTGIEAEVLDSSGQPVAQPSQAASIPSNPYSYLLPHGSRLDWLISHGGITLIDDPTNKYALVVGGRGWLIPIETASSYSLRIRVRGLPWVRADENPQTSNLKVLWDVPPTRLDVTQ
jgi:hypothetical protein